MMTTRKPKKLTPSQLAALKRLAGGTELVFIKPGGWWMGDDQINRSTGVALLELDLIVAVFEDHGMRDKQIVYNINLKGKDRLAEHKDKYGPTKKTVLPDGSGETTKFTCRRCKFSGKLSDLDSYKNTFSCPSCGCIVND